MATVRLGEALTELVDGLRGDVPRERFVRRALEQALGGEAVKQPAGQVSGVVGPSRSEVANGVRQESGRAPAVSSSRALAPASARAHRPERHEFGSGEEWQAAVRAWKGAQ